jgi:hypothetical protein
MSNKTYGGKPLRDWACPSYNARTGKACSAFGPQASIEGMKIAGHSQVEAANTAGVGGAPGWHEVDKSRTQGKRSKEEKWSER